MKRFLGTVVAVGFGGALAYGIIQLFVMLSPFSISTGARHQLEYSDFISLMLTAVSIILAALGFVVALLAFVGWNSIGERVTSLSTKLFHDSLSDEGDLRSIVQDSLQEGGELYSLVQDEAKEIIYRAIEPIRPNGDDDDTDLEDQT
jgi:hypothetical protein